MAGGDDRAMRVAAATGAAGLVALSAIAIISGTAGAAQRVGPGGRVDQLQCLSAARTRDCLRLRGTELAKDRDTELNATVSADGRHVYVGAAEGVFVLQRDADGRLKQLPGRSGCVTRSGLGGCARAHGLGRSRREVKLALSRDGRSLYSLTLTHPWVLVSYRRDVTTGKLTQLRGPRGCSMPIALHGCRSLEVPSTWAYSVTLSPDGRFLYVATAFRLLAWMRDVRSGALRAAPGRTRCVAVNGLHDCAAARWPFHPLEVSFTRDSRFAYVASNHSAVEVFSRDAPTGSLTPLPGPRGCYQDATRSEQLFPPFRRVGSCTDIPGVVAPTSVQLSSDDRFAYVLGDAIVTFMRDAGDGDLNPLKGPDGCLGRAPGCNSLPGMTNLSVPYKLAVSADGDNAYVTFSNGGNLAVLARDRIGGGLRQLPGAAGCLQVGARRSCGRTSLIETSTAAPAIDPLGRAVYVGGSRLTVLRRRTRPMPGWRR